MGGDPFCLPLVEQCRLACGSIHQSLAPREQPPSIITVNLQRFHAERQTKLAFALAGLEMRVDLVWRKQKRNALVAGVGNKAGLGIGRCRQHQARAHR